MTQLKLTPLLNLIESMPSYQELVDRLQEQKSNIAVTVLDAAKSYLLAAIYHNLQLPALIITAQPEKAKQVYEQLSIWCNSDHIKLIPEPAVLPYQRTASDSATEQEKLEVLSSLANIGKNQKQPFVVTSVPAFIQKVMPYSNFTSAVHSIKPGMEIEPFKLLRGWEEMGYRVENTVEVPGTMSHRGGIVDIYPPTSDLPVRLEFFGNTIDSIRLFDPATQRSLKTASSVTISPATELLPALSMDKNKLESITRSLDLSNLTQESREQLQEELSMLAARQRPANAQFYAPLFNQDSILSYLPPDTLILLDKPSLIRQAVEDLDTQASRLRSDKLKAGELPIGYPRPYFTWDELEPKIKEWQNLSFISLNTTDSEDSYQLKFAPAPSYAGQLSTFIKKMKQLLEQKHRVVITSYQASRLSELFNEQGIFATPVTEITHTPPPDSLILVQGSLAYGWVMPGNTHFFTDAEIFGFVKQRRFIKKHPVPHHNFLSEFKPDEYIVHVEHGVGKFAGVTRLSTDSTEKDYLVLLYAVSDKLYVPTDQIDRVSRYVGTSDQPPVLSRLGTLEWTRTKQKVKESVEEIAKNLLQLYASREVLQGYAFSPDTVWQQEMEASFPYVETPDQLRTQEEVKADMSKPRPMDRLVCGDVGYGKTEVAIRATFKAVMDSKQVAVLVPTTVLAQQHYITFKQRLSAFPVRIEVLSRFRSTKEQEKVIEGLADGTVDICIGTHRLLQKDIKFKNLGLLVIDEEQRFGVAHKEHIKQMRHEVDVLTLSATPIPRTLHMSLVGVRDMSTIETPPEDRLPIKTYVAEYDEHLVREAILRELERNGQVFFVHNRVQSIGYIASKLESLVPEARVAVAHGQMPEEKLEKIMVDFAQGKIDILVCTTIIESGLDMPNVNTLIVNQADRLGLTQLYQLRGRIGRGSNLAYAYFLYDRNKRLTPTAEKRLQTIFEATELGAGFNIAMKDLEIRGAGTLLGTRQSGHINAVGFSLYTQLLAQAVEAQKSKQARGAGEKEKPLHLPPPSIDLPLAAYIPEKYVTDMETRLNLYQSLAKADKEEKVDELAREFKDRFGAPPQEVLNLLYSVKLKALAARAGIESISTQDSQIVLQLIKGMQFTQKQREHLSTDSIKVGTSQLRINRKRLGKDWQKTLENTIRQL